MGWYVQYHVGVGYCEAWCMRYHTALEYHTKTNMWEIVKLRLNVKSKSNIPIIYDFTSSNNEQYTTCTIYTAFLLLCVSLI